MLILNPPPSAEQMLIAHAHAHAQDLSTSQYVQNLLPKSDQQPHESLAWEHGKDLFGCWESHDETLSQNVKKLVPQKTSAKHGKICHKLIKNETFRGNSFTQNQARSI